MSCSATLGTSSSWSHLVMAMYSLQSGCVSLTSATCIIHRHPLMSMSEAPSVCRSTSLFNLAWDIGIWCVIVQQQQVP